MSLGAYAAQQDNLPTSSANTCESVATGFQSLAADTVLGSSDRVNGASDGVLFPTRSPRSEGPAVLVEPVAPSAARCARAADSAARGRLRCRDGSQPRDAGRVSDAPPPWGGYRGDEHGAGGDRRRAPGHARARRV